MGNQNEAGAFARQEAGRLPALVVGAGPAGLMAAEALGAAGVPVVIAEALAAPARKFLMAGKSGLNLTRAEPFDRFLAAYAEAAPHLRPMLADFGPDQVCGWAEGLGQPVFTGSTGRVFPTAMKASPLLRAWLGRLAGQGASLRRRWHWAGWDGAASVFDTPDGPRRVEAEVTILAFGGASWARLGSNGAWAGPLADAGLPLAPFRPANVGLKVDWSAPMARHYGAPVKGVALRAGSGGWHRGEFVISARGLEGGGIYALSRPLREGAPLLADLLPDRDAAWVAERLARPRGKASLSNHLRKALGLDPARLALLMEFGRPLPGGPALAALIKALPIAHAGPRPLDEAISTAGGLGWKALDSDLMLEARPGTYAAGEMLDWEAPTGGYLLTACLATGLWAGRRAAARLGRPV
ncbi:TIGR03862 family flavoprotein [Rhodovulum sulfidophilum]|uniref:TIGR03862 family flavoprotein n=1 Tax=Rhodovulum sulfidophilum TaxID=35806 RepID=UPI00095141C9|nr:TIGR03862 family flavoprotein [Rhodovulum sulfidophilum]MBL3553798.1 TIGR03862 family flavoprotein [Rhodovulum sulfidophilum]OLS50168.1 NAD(FAD)-utilizing dehydrogenase [Rhodovulum sulfidophilum]